MRGCQSWSKGVGCWHTFNGKCDKELCQTFNLLTENKELKNKIKQQEKEIKALNKKLVKVAKMCKRYEQQCNIGNNCIDPRLCSTCFLGGALEMGDEIKDILEE